MLRRSFRTYVAVGVVLGAIAVGAGGYLYFAWWIPNAKLTNPEWWQHASEDEMRSVCHQVLRFPIGNHHDAFLALASVGNAESVPLLVRALRWQDPPAPDGFVLCTTEHAVAALRSLTGEDLGLDPEKWQQWWDQVGSKLPSGHYVPRKRPTPRDETGQQDGLASFGKDESPVTEGHSQ